MPRDDKISYDGYQVYRVSTANAPRDLSRLRSFPSAAQNGFIEVAIPPKEIDSFKSLDLEKQLLNEDLGKLIRAESSAQKPASLTKRGELPPLSWFDSYHPYDDHVQY